MSRKQYILMAIVTILIIFAMGTSFIISVPLIGCTLAVIGLMLTVALMTVPIKKGV